jgi:hypothetical protein
VEQATGGRKIVGEQVNCCDYRKEHRRGWSGLICGQATFWKAGTEERADIEKVTALIEVKGRLPAEFIDLCLASSPHWRHAMQLIPDIFSNSVNSEMTAYRHRGISQPSLQD